MAELTSLDLSMALLLSEMYWALCLSSLGYDHCASRNPDASCCHEDKHKAPTRPRVHPLSLQDGGDLHRRGLKGEIRQKGEKRANMAPI
jgi:hypothetical protein